MASTFTEAIHLVSSDSAAGLVKQAGAPRRQVLSSSDLLTVGPCDVEPEHHIELRRAWNADDVSLSRQAFGLDDLRAAIADDRPIIVWATRAYADLIWLWWVLDGFERLGPHSQPLIVARPVPEDARTTVGGSTVEQAITALASAHPVQHAELREGADLWSKYASPVPLAFDEARRSGSLTFPELGDSAELHGAWFPRLEHGRIRLAELDELLLGQLNNSWLTTRDLIREMPGRERLLWPFGGSIPVLRLQAWAAHGVVAREIRSHDSHLEQDAFRMTDRTRTLLMEGLDVSVLSCYGPCLLKTFPPGFPGAA